MVGDVEVREKTGATVQESIRLSVIETLALLRANGLNTDEKDYIVRETGEYPEQAVPRQKLRMTAKQGSADCNLREFLTPCSDSEIDSRHSSEPVHLTELQTLVNIDGVVYPVKYDPLVDSSIFHQTNQKYNYITKWSTQPTSTPPSQMNQSESLNVSELNLSVGEGYHKSSAHQRIADETTLFCHRCDCTYPTSEWYPHSTNLEGEFDIHRDIACPSCGLYWTKQFQLTCTECGFEQWWQETATDTGNCGAELPQCSKCGRVGDFTTNSHIH